VDFGISGPHTPRPRGGETPSVAEQGPGQVKISTSLTLAGDGRGSGGSDLHAEVGLQPHVLDLLFVGLEGVDVPLLVFEDLLEQL
jgi:hypothetical protein